MQVCRCAALGHHPLAAHTEQMVGHVNSLWRSELTLHYEAGVGCSTAGRLHPSRRPAAECRSGTAAGEVYAAMCQQGVSPDRHTFRLLSRPGRLHPPLSVQHTQRGEPRHLCFLSFFFFCLVGGRYEIPLGGAADHRAVCCESTYSWIFFGNISISNAPVGELHDSLDVAGSTCQLHSASQNALWKRKDWRPFMCEDLYSDWGVKHCQLDTEGLSGFQRRDPLCYRHGRALYMRW